MKTIGLMGVIGLMLVGCDAQKPAVESKAVEIKAPSREKVENQIRVQTLLVEMAEGNIETMRESLNATTSAGAAALKAEDLRRATDDLEERRAELEKLKKQLAPESH
jgi:hypothetical protein